MLFFILSIAVVIGFIVLTEKNSEEKALSKFSKLECKRDVAKSYKFCC